MGEAKVGDPDLKFECSLDLYILQARNDCFEFQIILTRILIVSLGGLSSLHPQLGLCYDCWLVCVLADMLILFTPR